MQDRVGAADRSSSHVITINAKLDALSSSPPTHTIFKVHKLLRRENAMAYEPEILAIGPYHRGKEHLQAMEVWKLRGLKSILDLHKEKDATEYDATEYVEAMKKLEGTARECYSESTICINADEFAEMLLLDGCFIIQFILSVMHCHMHDSIIDHCFFEAVWVKGSLCRDMLLLENQIPLFVLEKLFSLTKLSNDRTDHFLDIAQKFAGIAFKNFTHSHDNAQDLDSSGSALCFSCIPIPPKATVSGSALCSSSIPIPPKATELSTDSTHLLGLLHRAFCLLVINIHEAQDSRPSNSVDDNGTGLLLTRSRIKLLAEKLRCLSCGMLSDDKAAVNEWNSATIPSATKLHDAGVTLKMKNVDKENPFKVTFVNGVMEVPIFNVFDGTETVYRNLIAYEQYFQQNSNCCFSEHASFMDYLIDSPEDVALLSRCGIIGNFIGDDEAISTMFNKLCKHITIPLKKGNYAQTFERVNDHCRKRRHRWMAKLKRDYFNHPWSVISFLAAVLLLLLTVTQTVFSALGS